MEVTKRLSSTTAYTNTQYDNNVDTIKVLAY